MKAETLVRAGFAALFTYFFAVGGTFNGIFLIEVQALTLPLLGVLVVGWLLLHWRLGWRWYRTPFDAPFIAWGTAILISLAANPNNARQILIGVWFIWLYFAVWYLLADVLSNLDAPREGVVGDVRPQARLALVDGMLIAGSVVLIFGFWQTVTAGRSPNAGGIFGFIRPVSTAGNPNSLATMLILLLGLSAGRLIGTGSRFWRVIVGLYAVAAALLLLLTASRGGWIGGAAAIITAVGLWLMARQLASPARLFQWYRAGSMRLRLALGVAGLGLVIGLIVMGLIILASFNAPGRSAELRTYIWETALSLFAEKPLTGHGLNTFGSGLTRLNSMPPLSPHSHAHSLPLNVLAELGLPGAFALLFSLVVALRMTWQNWVRATAGVGRLANTSIAVLAAGIAAMVGFGVHHLFDLAAMMPILAVGGMIVLMVATLPLTPAPIVMPFRRYGHPVVMGGLWVVLLASGLWSSGVYRQYFTIVREGANSGDYVTAAERLQPVIDADPAMPVYRWQQAYFLGSAAYLSGDEDAAAQSIAAFERLTEMQPHVAGVWANRAGLLWQIGSTDEALDSWRTAAEAASQSWALWLTYARHAELAGQDAPALEGYGRLIEVVDEDEVGVYLHPVLQESALFQSLEIPTTTGLARMVEVWQTGGEGAARLALNLPQPEAELTTVRGLIVRALLAHVGGDTETALDWYAQAESRLQNDQDRLWISYAQAVLAGDDLAAFRAQIAPDVLRPDYPTGINWWRNIFLRDVTPRSFLPQAGYEWIDPLLVALLGESPNIE